MCGVSTFGGHGSVTTPWAQALSVDRGVGDLKPKQLGLTLAHRAGRGPSQKAAVSSRRRRLLGRNMESITSRAKLEKPISTSFVQSGCAKQEHQRD